ncbi:TPA: hypothetical protein G8W61_004341 [Salmonella enterica]|uniref:Uncharacterized protein n=1 Tax=Salmonella enterica TaxID=28901 RepID=A0A759YRP2_SALER|nr:hypothetical protein [Salmonella enterica]
MTTVAIVTAGVSKLVDSVRLAAGAFGCLPGAFVNGRQRKAPNDFFINQSRQISNASQH